MNETWRCFLAVPLPESLRASLRERVEGWRRSPGTPDLRWTAPDGWHLTLAFLGSVPASDVPGLLAAVRPVAAARPAWTASTGALGTFPGPRRARVVWYGVADPDGRLARLAAEVRSTLEPMVPALVGTSAFRAHVTLARARDPRGTDVSTWLAAKRAPEGSIDVDRVVLYRSHLGRGPAAYEAIGSLALGGPGDAMMEPETEASDHG